jgi:hypothetical protein
MKKLPPLQPVERLIRTASLHAAGALPLCNHQSLPIPMPGDMGLQVAFLYGRAVTAPSHERFLIAPPQYTSFVDAETGAFRELRRLSEAQEVDLPASFAGPALDAPELVGRRNRLLCALEVLMPPFAAGMPRLAGAALRTAFDLDPLFREVAEPAFVPYYADIGRLFFTWLARVTS